MNRFARAPTPKPFNFTWTKIKNFETCPRKYLEVDVLKNYQETSEQLTYGNKMHEAAAAYISRGTLLPAEFEMLEKWIHKFTNDSDALTTMWTEVKLAINRDKKGCDWFGKDVYMRGIIDFLKIRKNVALVVDWKSGEPKEDLIQLGLFAQLVFSNYNFVEAVKTIYVWVKADDCTEEDLYKRDMKDLWSEINPRVQALETAVKTDNFPPKKSGLCKAYCPVITCEYNGR